MKRITQYDGLYGESDTKPDGEYIFSELLQTRSSTFDWVIEPHIHARLFQVFFVETGQVTFSESTRKRELIAPVVLLIPSTALHGFVYSSDATGRIVTLSDALVSNLFPANSALIPMLETTQCLSVFDAPHSVARVRELIEQFNEELFDNQAEKPLMLRACLQRLFILFFRIWQHHETIQNDINSPALTYFRKFQQRVRQAGTTLSVAQLADELAITPVHLNRICRAIMDRTASEIVQEHILNEARKYLTYTSYTISEIAYLLHFEYPTYFARFFKKHTGLSPTEFREGLRSTHTNTLL
jgi:AraC family transcriptional regulator, transcriptional activator of pobA